MDLTIAKKKYHVHKGGATARGIEWHFTFETWLAWWGNDWPNRGNRSGQLVMARKNDTGPYHPDNVEKITSNQNHSDCHKNGLGWNKGSKHKIETCIQISNALKNIPRPPQTYTRLTCPHCNTTASKGNAIRWHMDNCKHA